MATYPVDPNDATTPTNSQGAKQGAEEFRALKAKVNSIAVANTAGSSVRQAIQSANLDANGLNNAITVGVGLRPGLTATANPYHLSYASGFTLGKVNDQYEAIVADVVDILAADLPINNTSYIYRTFATLFKSTLVPKQEGYIFDKSKYALLNFEGLNGANTTTDDFGNAWLLTAATITTAQKQFGTSSLDCTGAAKYAESVAFTSFGDGSWEASLWFRPNVLPAASTQYLFNAGNAANWGIALGLNDTAGTKKLSLSLSSNGTAFDIAAASLGTNTVWAAGTWYKARIVFDALTGTYRVYLSIAGAVETQDISVASALRICAITAFTIGTLRDHTQGWNGYIDSFRFLPCATKPAIEVPAIIAPTVTDYVINFFQIPAMKMFEVTAASVVSGTNPTLTAANNLFLAEADTSGVAVTAVRNYAIKCQYVSADTAIPAVGTRTSFSAKIGSYLVNTLTYIRNYTADQGFTPGMVIQPNLQGNAAFAGGMQTTVEDKNTLSFTTGSTAAVVVFNRTTGALAGVTTANWKMFVVAERSF